MVFVTHCRKIFVGRNLIEEKSCSSQNGSEHGQLYVYFLGGGAQSDEAAN